MIEPMVEQDIDYVQQVERESFPTLWSPHTYRRELRQAGNSRYIVARASPNPPIAHQERQPPPRTSGWSHMLRALWLSLSKVPPVSSNGEQTLPLVGYAGVWVTFDEGHITTIAVARRYRGSGVGEVLLNGLIDHARELGAVSMTLEVRVSNTVAQNLYSKYGFTVEGRRKRYYPDNGEDALIMWTEAMTDPEYQARLKHLRQDLYARLRSQAEAHRHRAGGEEWAIYSL
jgi:ribosomal-protein-alanine N-acetyltransferase